MKKKAISNESKLTLKKFTVLEFKSLKTIVGGGDKKDEKGTVETYPIG
jgi:hypothetical protein